MTWKFRRKPVYYLKNIDRYCQRLLLRFSPSHKPAFMIIGAQKAATTSLYNYLNQLRGFQGSVNKEIYYFDREYNYGKNLDWYHRYFKSFSLSKDTLFFEATPNYFYYPWVAERLYKYIPGLKLIVVLREPISRAYSAWNMYKSFFESKELYRVHKGLRPGEQNYIHHYLFQGRTTFPSFEECIEIELDLLRKERPTEEPSLLRRGLYCDQLSNYYQFFKPEQILIVGYSDIAKDAMGVVRALHAGITGKLEESISFKIERRNARNYSDKISSRVKEQLDRFYSESNEKLWKLIGKKVNW